jgi:HSP20 family molecular chaperone IbpA
MKITDHNSEALDYAKKTDSKRINLVAKKENEIEHLKKFYEKKVDDTKLEGEDRFINSVKKNDDLLTVASKDYEDKLNNYKGHLQETQKSIANEENDLKVDHFQKMDDFKEQHLRHMHDEYLSANNDQEAVYLQTQNRMHSINDKAHTLKNKLQSTSTKQINDLSNDYNQKLASKNRDYKTILDNDHRSHQEDINLQKVELKKVMEKNFEQNKRLETEKIKVQTSELSYLDNHQKDLLSQKQSDFKIRYENLVKGHNALINELQTHFDADIKKLSLQNASQKRTVTNKNDDPFYRIETLNPSITETQKEYEISLTVPEYERENVHMSIHGRGVKMTLSRKFSDLSEEKDGSTNKFSHTELFSKDFPSNDILDPKQVVQKYENGILTFKIQKL